MISRLLFRTPLAIARRHTTGLAPQIVLLLGLSVQMTTAGAAAAEAAAPLATNAFKRVAGGIDAAMQADNLADLSAPLS